MNELMATDECGSDDKELTLIKRTLHEKELRAFARDYYCYSIQNNNPGICYGASLYWASDALKNVGTNRFPPGIKWSNPHHYRLNNFDYKFYNFSSFIHKAYARLFERNGRGIATVAKRMNAESIEGNKYFSLPAGHIFIEVIY